MIKKKLIKKPLKKPILKKSFVDIDWVHPEQQPDERFIANSNDKSFKQILWKTKRKGTVSYNIITNEKLDDSKLFPVFIKKQEFIDYIEGKFNLSDNLPNKGKLTLIKLSKRKRGSYKIGKDVHVFID